MPADSRKIEMMPLERISLDDQLIPAVYKRLDLQHECRSVGADRRQGQPGKRNKRREAGPNWVL